MINEDLYLIARFTISSDIEDIYRRRAKMQNSHRYVPSPAFVRWLSVLIPLLMLAIAVAA